MKKGLIKTTEEIETLAQGGKILARILQEVASAVAPGVTTAALNELAERIISEAGAQPSFKGYGEPRNPYPAVLCTSVNDVVVHGVPGRTALEEGDIVGLDLGIMWKGLYTDAAVTVPVGNVDADTRKLLSVTREALLRAVSQATARNHIGDISCAIQKTVEAAGFSVVRDLQGHGVGYAVHEDPAIPCFGKPGTGARLATGMILAVEPMVNAGGWRVVFEPDGWTVRTADGTRSAHFEYTVAVTDSGGRVLTE